MIRLEKIYSLFSGRQIKINKFLYKKGFRNIYKDRINFHLFWL